MNRNIYIFSLCLLTNYGLQATEKAADIPEKSIDIVFMKITKKNITNQTLTAFGIVKAA